MSKELDPKNKPGGPKIYQFRIESHLGQQWADWFGGMTLTLEEDGNTLLTGPVIDQAGSRTQETPAPGRRGFDRLSGVLCTWSREPKPPRLFCAGGCPPVNGSGG